MLLNPVKLYPLLDAATSSLTADPGLDSLGELYDFARSLQRTPADQVRFLTVPREPYVHDHNRDELTQPEADELFTTLRQDGNVAITTKSAESGKGARTRRVEPPPLLPHLPWRHTRARPPIRIVCPDVGERNLSRAVSAR